MQSQVEQAILFLATCAIAAGMVLLGSSCASITPTYDRDGNLKKIESAKFLADLAYEEEVEYAADGKTVVRRKVKYATETNADKILNSANSVFGTLFNGAAKVMP